MKAVDWNFTFILFDKCSLDVKSKWSMCVNQTDESRITGAVVSSFFELQKTISFCRIICQQDAQVYLYA